MGEPAHSSRCLQVRSVRIPPRPVATEPTTACTAKSGFQGKVVARFDRIRAVRHPNLCEYVEMVVNPPPADSSYTMVSEHHSQTLRDLMPGIATSLRKASKQGVAVRLRAQDEIVQRHALECLQAMAALNRSSMVHGYLHPASLVVTAHDTLKVTDHAVHELISLGSDAPSPQLFQPTYLAPEVARRLAQLWPQLSPKADVWSLGIILLECVLGRHPLTDDSVDLGDARRVADAVQQLVAMRPSSTGPRRRAASTSMDLRDHPILARHADLPLSDGCRQFLGACLAINPLERPTPEQLLLHPYLANQSRDGHTKWMQTPTLHCLACDVTPWQRHAFADSSATRAPADVLESLTNWDVYYLWQKLAGGQVDECDGTLPPAVFGFPFRPIRSFVQESRQMAQESSSHVGTGQVRIVSLKEVRAVVNKALGGGAAEADGGELTSAEVDIVWSVSQSRRLLKSWETMQVSSTQVCEMAKLGIPDPARPGVWAVVLGSTRQDERVYDQWLMDRLDTGAHDVSPTDKNSVAHQIHVDVERCHQYHPLLSSERGKSALRDVLQCWVDRNKDLCYWQGLDSLCAPLLVLSFDNHPRVFACLQALTHGHMRNMFMSEKANVLKGLLQSFAQLLAYHDPLLASHLNSIAFQPDLYALPWFLTLFAHIMPMSSIFPLWDVILTGQRCLSLFVAVAIVMSLHDRVINASFDSCIIIFSNLPTIKVDQCTHHATDLLANTPHTITTNAMPPELGGEGANDNAVDDWLDLMRDTAVPVISIDDVLRLQSTAIILDVRPEDTFRSAHLPNALHMASHKLPTKLAGQLHAVQRTQEHQQPIFVVVGHQKPEASQFAMELTKAGLQHVCLLRDALLMGAESFAGLLRERGVEEMSKKNVGENLVSGVMGVGVGVVGVMGKIRPDLSAITTSLTRHGPLS